MKNSLKLICIAVIALLAVIFTAGCKSLDSAAGGEKKLDSPKNIKIEINVRQMIITWDAVPNAQGYEIITASVNCGSGNRIINTKDNTALAPNGSNVLAGGANLISANGTVQIHGKNKIEITLMPEWNIPGNNQSGRNENRIMASSVSAKVKALGGLRGYHDSDFSGEVKFDTSAL